MIFSKRTRFGMGESNDLSNLLTQKREDGMRILDLTESNPTRCHFRSLNESILKPLQDPRSLIYDPDPRGMLSAREAVASYYAKKNIGLHPDQIFLTASTSEAYSHCFHLLCDPGDSVLRMTPGYPLLDSLASLSDVRLESCAYSYEKAWRLDRAAFQRALHKTLRGCVFVNPANPTGNYLSGEDSAWVKTHCSEKELALISDEVFFDFDWDNKPRQSMASSSKALTLTLSGISKTLGLPQMKLSWMVVQGPEKARKEACSRLEHVLDAFLSVATPSQVALNTWFTNLPNFTEEVRTRVRTNLTYIEKSLAGMPHTLCHAEGGWFIIVKTATQKSEEMIAIELLDKQGVLVHPGYLFDFEFSCLVISLLPEVGIFEEAVNHLTHCLGSQL